MKDIIVIRQASLSLLTFMIFGTSCATRPPKYQASGAEIEERAIAAVDTMREIAALQVDIDRLAMRLQKALGADHVATAIESARAKAVPSRQREISVLSLEAALRMELQVKEAELRALGSLLLVGGGGL